MPSRNRGKSKQKLRDLSRIPPTKEERKAVQQELIENESPIATAILGATIVEMELETELRTRFSRKDDDTWKDLTADGGPLGTFNQKIVAAYGFRILDDVLRDGMDTVRHIRNAFAHSKRLIDFNHELVTRELRLVTLPKGKRSALYKQFLAVRTLREGRGVLMSFSAWHWLFGSRREETNEPRRELPVRSAPAGRFLWKRFARLPQQIEQSL